MTTKTQEIEARFARYNRVERAVDELGRTIGVRQLKPSQVTRVQELAPNLKGMTTVIDDDTGMPVEVADITPLIAAASVCEVDDLPIPFPKNRAELDAVYDMLDTEGMKAVGKALSQFQPIEKPAVEAGNRTEVDTAKN